MKFATGQSGMAASAMLEGDDSNESTESSAILGFRGFGSSSPGPSMQLSNLNTTSQGVWDSNERIRNAIAILKLMCESTSLDSHFHQLLGEKYVSYFHFR